LRYPPRPEKKGITEMPENKIADLKEFFARGSRPVNLNEVTEFWKNLTPEEKEYYKNADLS